MALMQSKGSPREDGMGQEQQADQQYPAEEKSTPDPSTHPNLSP